MISYNERVKTKRGKRMQDKRFFDEADEFWSLDDLLPQKEKKLYSPTPRDTNAVDFEINGDASERKGEKIPERKYPPITSAPKNKSFEEWLSERKKYEDNRFTYGKVTVSEYVPENPLIKKVTISIDPNAGRFSERFLRDALRLYESECEFRGNVPFRSYYPQYSQMNAEQIACYIGFRTDARRGVFNNVDTAYIYLYLYEIINTPQKAPHEERAKSICNLIKAYYNLDDRLLSDMCNWLCDLCLIYNVQLKPEYLGNTAGKVTSACRIKEFFIGSDTKLSRDYALISAVSSYDYKKSRFYQENKEAYDKFIPASTCAAIAEMSKNDSRFLKEQESACTLIHESYNGALCTSEVKFTISLECVCITRSENVKKAVSEAVKYSENCLRSHLGIKPRLTVNYLLTDYKSVIKAFFRKNLGAISKHSINACKITPNVEVRPEYEELYEPQSHGVSFEEAKEIEESSWEITKKLVTEPLEDPEPAKETMPRDTKRELYGLMYILKKDIKAFGELARSNGMLTDAFADEINSFSLEVIGDIAITVGENGYEIIEDYITDITDILSENGLL